MRNLFFEVTIQELSEFETLSGMIVNYDKSVIYHLGSMRKMNAKFYSNKKLIWSDEPLKILGIIVSNSEDEVFKLNFEPVIEKIEMILKMWKQRDLSLSGKIMVVNTLVISKLIHELIVLPPNAY